MDFSSCRGVMEAISHPMDTESGYRTYFHFPLRIIMRSLGCSSFCQILEKALAATHIQKASVGLSQVTLGSAELELLLGFLIC